MWALALLACSQELEAPQGSGVAKRLDVACSVPFFEVSTDGAVVLDWSGLAAAEEIDETSVFVTVVDRTRDDAIARCEESAADEVVDELIVGTEGAGATLPPEAVGADVSTYLYVRVARLRLFAWLVAGGDPGADAVIFEPSDLNPDFQVTQ